MTIRQQLLRQWFAVYFTSDAACAAVADAENSAQFCQQLLLSDINEEEDDIELIHPSQVLTGFSAATYVDQMALMIIWWYETQQNPLHEQPVAINGVVEDLSSYNQLLHVPIDRVHVFVHTILTQPDTHLQTTATTQFLTEIGGARGILTLLGFRQTVGSRTMPPLTRCQCLQAFQQPHRGTEVLTIGARAFTKHCQRSSDGWWGVSTGNDHRKNSIALAKVMELLATAVWKNIHSLPHAQATMELRNAEGYGARWYVANEALEVNIFRGFLEPQMAGGHETKWRH